jgi:hypothetical protein
MVACAVAQRRANWAILADQTARCSTPDMVALSARELECSVRSASVLISAGHRRCNVDRIQEIAGIQFRKAQLHSDRTANLGEEHEAALPLVSYRISICIGLFV